MFCLLIKLFWSCDVMIYFCSINVNNINFDISCKTYSKCQDKYEIFPKILRKICRKVHALKIAGNAFLDLRNLKMSQGSMPPTPLGRWAASCWNYLFSFDQTANLSKKNLNLSLHLPVIEVRCLDNFDFGVDGLNFFVVASKKGTFKLSLKCSIKVNYRLLQLFLS